MNNIILNQHTSFKKVCNFFEITQEAVLRILLPDPSHSWVNFHKLVFGGEIIVHRMDYVFFFCSWTMLTLLEWILHGCGLKKKCLSRKSHHIRDSRPSSVVGIGQFSLRLFLGRGIFPPGTLHVHL